MRNISMHEYTSRYPDVILSGLDAKKHWEVIGSKIGREIDRSETNCIEKGICSDNLTTQIRLGINGGVFAAVFLHLYYRDLWPEIELYLKKIPIDYDLYITLSDDQGPSETIRDMILTNFPQAIITEHPNRGLDCAPFLETYRAALKKGKKYKYGLKLHTKKSLGSDPIVGTWWRKKTLESLLGSSQIVLRILNRLSDSKKIGMIGPANSRMSVSENDVAHNANVNLKHYEKLANVFQVKDKSLDFFCGTMFWFRCDCFDSFLINDVININDFEPGYKVDGLLAHGVERILPSMVRDKGKEIYEQNYITDVVHLKYNKKSICFVHPGYGIGGGNRVLFDVGSALSQFYNVYSVSSMGSPFGEWMKVKHPVIKFDSDSKVEELLAITNCDFVFATGWQTFDFVNKLPSHYKKFYFIQDYEPWFVDGKESVATYNNNFDGNFVIADWLKKKLLKDHNLKTTFIRLGVGEIHNKLNIKPKTKPATLLCYHKLRGHQGRGADLIEKFLQIAVGLEDVEIKVIGHEDPYVTGAQFIGELHGEELENLYKEADIFIDLSRHRGIATMAMEMAQFGVVPILSRPEFGLEEYGFVSKKTALFANTPEEAIVNVNELIKNNQLFEYMSKEIQNLSQSYNYGNTIKTIVQVLEGI